MANTLYDKGRQRFLEGAFNWLTDTVKCILVSSAYTPNFTTHEFLSDVSSSARVGPTAGVSLTSKTTTGGAADASDITFSAISGSTVTALILYQGNSGVESSEPLIAYIDTATGLPITPNGGDIIVTWDNGTNRIFKL